MFYGLYENLSGGSPAISSLPNAIDIPLIRSAFVNKFPDDLSPVQLASFEDEEEEFEESVKTSTSSKEIPKQIEKVSEMLKNCKDKKMTSWISSDNQLLQLTREDIAFKKKMLEKMEKSDNELRTELANLNQVMSNIGFSIQQSVGILGQLLSNQSRVFPPPTPFHHARDFLPNVSLCEMCLNTEFFLVCILPHTDTSYLSVFCPNAGKYGPQKTPYLDTFHAVYLLEISYQTYSLLAPALWLSLSYLLKTVIM